MGNMSYCRFENTARDLEDCLEAIENYEFDEMSVREKDGLHDLLGFAQQITEYKSRIEDAILNYYKD